MISPTTLQTVQQWLGSGSINIFGRPFAGKDTQGRKLAELLDAALLGGGEILRNSHIPDDVHQSMLRGQLIPSESYVSIVLPYLSQERFKGMPLILSSVGRWVGEENGVIEVTNTAEHPLKAVVYLELDEDIVRTRWSALEQHDDRGGRYDDTATILEKRLAEFREKTLPVLDHYDKLGLLVRVDGTLTPDEVTNRIIEALVSHASTSP